MSQPHLEQLRTLLAPLPPITLSEMKSIRLMKRTDTKFVTSFDRLLELLRAVEGHYLVQTMAGNEVLCPYATTYFDDDTRSLYHQHQHGALPRTKVRVRSYELDGETFLEVKRKDNHGKTHKRRIAVPSVAAVEEGVGADFVEEQTGLSLTSLSPSMCNRFRRITLVNIEKTERLTIDVELHFFAPGQPPQPMKDTVIIELKRDGRVPSPILPILRRLRIRPHGFSKYCIGTTLEAPGVRVNRFKKRLRSVRLIVARSTAPEHSTNNVPPRPKEHPTP